MQRLRVAGGLCAADAVPAAGGARVAWFRDPDGNLLLLTQVPVRDVGVSVSCEPSAGSS